jgi:hypothetical protein
MGARMYAYTSTQRRHAMMWGQHPTHTHDNLVACLLSSTVYIYAFIIPDAALSPCVCPLRGVLIYEDMLLLYVHDELTTTQARKRVPAQSGKAHLLTFLRTPDDHR